MKKFIDCSIVLFVLFLNVACIYQTEIVEQMRTTRLAMVKQIEETQANAIEGANKFRRDMAAKGKVSDNIEDIQSAATEYDNRMAEWDKKYGEIRKELASMLQNSPKEIVQPIGRLKGRSFQELVNLSNDLTDIMYDHTLSQTRRAEILSIMLQTDYNHMYQGIKEADESCRRGCDGPCFAAIQDTIIVSYTDETLDVFWYYEKQGKDSVLMFDMNAFNQCFPDLQK